MEQRLGTSSFVSGDYCYSGTPSWRGYWVYVRQSEVMLLDTRCTDCCGAVDGFIIRVLADLLVGGRLSVKSIVRILTSKVPSGRII